jgi:hypothetical protein
MIWASARMVMTRDRSTPQREHSLVDLKEALQTGQW